MITIRYEKRVLLHLGFIDIDYAIRKNEPRASAETSTVDVINLNEKSRRSNRLSMMFIKTKINADVRCSIEYFDKVKPLLKVIDEQSTTSIKALVSTLSMQFSSTKVTGIKRGV